MRTNEKGWKINVFMRMVRKFQKIDQFHNLTFELGETLENPTKNRPGGRCRLSWLWCAGKTRADDYKNFTAIAREVDTAKQMLIT